MAIKGRYIYEWPMLMVTVDAAVFAFSGGRAMVLLIERGNDPFKGRWALPGGFVEIDEELEDAAARELAEETGVSGISLEQVRTFGKCGRDPRGRQISIVYMGVAEDWPVAVRAGDDASSAKWFDVEKLPGDLAFDHNQVLEICVGKLKKE